MDPNLFHLDWTRVSEVLVAIIVLAFLLERALALLFESRFFLEVVQGKKPDTRKTAKGGQANSQDGGAKTTSDCVQPCTATRRFPSKELIAFVVAAAVCLIWDFDAVSMILLKERTTILGALVTGGIVAGGSKASVKLFRDVLGIKSTARKLQDKCEEANAN